MYFVELCSPELQAYSPVSFFLKFWLQRAALSEAAYSTGFARIIGVSRLGTIQMTLYESSPNVRKLTACETGNVNVRGGIEDGRGSLQLGGFPSQLGG